MELAPYVFARLQKRYEDWAGHVPGTVAPTIGHSQRVADLLMAVIGEDHQNAALYRDAALCHDAGKELVAQAFLHKGGPLTMLERLHINEHAGWGLAILREIMQTHFGWDGIPLLHGMIAYGHHERWDGQGYPRKLARDDIPLPARLLSICDSWDAMVSDRPYRKGMSIEAAAEQLERGAGTQFDPDLVPMVLEVALLRAMVVVEEPVPLIALASA